MNKKIKIFLVLLLLLVSVGAVSAADDTNDTVASSDEAIIEEISPDSDELSSTYYQEVLTSNSHTITKENYSRYFSPKSGELVSSDVKAGDTINLQGDFENANFTFKVPVNIVGIDNAMKNSIVTFYSGASGSTILNLNIANSKQYAYGIFLNGASNCLVQNCFVNNTGASAYAVCLGNGANYNNVTNNNFNAYGITYGHGTRSTSPVLISGSHYNQISNNQVTCWDANGIYLSSYDGGPLVGGASTFNLIYNNTVKYMVLPTSWSYGIQIMGGNNTIKANKVIGAYRGISTSGSGNIIIDNQIYNLTGADYTDPKNEIAGEIGIVGSYHSVIRNNSIINSKILPSGSGISALDYSIIEDNTVEVLYRGSGINPQGSNIIIKNNKISTISGAGILSNTHAFNITIDGNNVTSQSGVGILIQKLSSKRMPGNITIINNYVKAGNSKVFAIDAKDVDSATNYLIENNFVPKGYGNITTPEGVFDASKPIYKFNGTEIIITPDSYTDYFKNNFLDSNVKDKDILIFKGNFKNEAFVINKQVKIIGNEATFNNVTFKVYSNGVWMENLTIKNKKSSNLNAWGILVYKVFGAKILNCDIEVYDPNAAYAIYVVESTDVDVINNTLFSSGDYLTYTLLAYTVDDCNFINNTIRTVGTNISYINTGMDACVDGDENCLDGNENCLDGDTFSGNHLVPAEVYRTYGILMLYASGNTVSGNKINATSNLVEILNTTNSTNSIVGIDLYYNSNNNIFSNNEIYIKAKDNYIYGMGVLGYKSTDDAPEGQGASNNQFINNNIVLDGTYFVEAFVIGRNSDNTQIISNTVNAKSDCVNYGVNLEISQGSTISNNDFTLNSDIIYGIQIFESSTNKISNNNIKANGIKVYGSTLSNSRNNEIINNIIFANSNDGEITFINFDKIPAGNAGIYLKSNSSNNIIKENNITSLKGYAVILDDEAIDNVISDNCLGSEKGIGDDAVNCTINNTVKDNYRYLIVGNIEGITIKYLGNGTLLFRTDDENLEGAVVKFYDIDRIEIASVNLKDGKAEFNYNFPNEIPGDSCVYAIVSKQNYKTQEFVGSLYIEKSGLTVLLEDVTGAIARNAKFGAVIKNILGKGVEGITVEFWVIDDGWEQYVGKAVSDKNGLVTLMGEIPQIYGENPNVIAKIKETDNYNSASNESSLTAYKLTSTSIVVNSKVYSNGVLATLKDEKGNVVHNKEVSVVLNGKTYPARTDSNGNILVPVISRGNYLVSLSFAGDDEYYASKNSAKITVMPSIVGNKNYAVYYGNTVKYSVRVMDSDGKYASAGKVVTIKVNGQTYKVSTDKNGYATKSLKLKAGSYTITSEYNGDKVSNKITFKPTLAAKNVVAKKSKKVKFSAKLVDKNGKALKSKKVTFKVKGKKYTAKTNKKGVATVSIKNLKVGKFTITSSFGGCTIKNTIKIKK